MKVIKNTIIVIINNKVIKKTFFDTNTFISKYNFPYYYNIASL